MCFTTKKKGCIIYPLTPIPVVPPNLAQISLDQVGWADSSWLLGTQAAACSLPSWEDLWAEIISV